jgi:hypothetical protein
VVAGATVGRSRRKKIQRGRSKSPPAAQAAKGR